MAKPRLIDILPDKLKPLKTAEVRLLDAAQDGKPLGLTVDDEGEPRRPDLPEDCNDSNTIRAEVIEWLCTNKEARELVSHNGLLVAGIKITGRLGLSFADIPFPLGFFDSVLDDDIYLQHARVKLLNLGGSRTKAISADGVKVKGDIFLDYGFLAQGEVRLLGADIGGNLNCDGGSFENKSGYALSADGVKVKGNVFLRKEFNATGEVCFVGADIGGNLFCTGGKFINDGGNALYADGIKVKGDVFLDEGFLAHGEVRLLGADIDGDLLCTGGIFENKGGYALNADRLKVKGSVFLDKEFHAHGEVRLLSADIGGQLSCRDGSFENKSGYALCAESMRVDGTFIWETKQRPIGSIDLMHARIGQLTDNKESWPESGKLLIDGFEYEALGPDATPKTAEERLEWIRLQEPRPFKPQPYEQLAKVLRNMGHESDARKVLIAKQDDLRKYGDLKWWSKEWNHFLGRTIGHGWKPWRVFVRFIIPFIIIGYGFFSWADYLQIMQPSKERVYMSEEFKDSGEIPAVYPKFSPLVYSVDTFVPFVNLHQENYWLPDASTRDGWWFRLYLWLHIALGWVFSTLAALSLTGIVRKE